MSAPKPQFHITAYPVAHVVWRATQKDGSERKSDMVIRHGKSPITLEGFIHMWFRRHGKEVPKCLP